MTRDAAVLTYLEGDVAIPPFPGWAASGALLASVADLQRRLQEAARSFEPPPDAVWDRANLPPAGPGAIVCHNDLCVENVVIRDGVAVAFIDFDFAAPNDPLIDIAIAARHWVPFRDPNDLDLGRHRPGGPLPGLLRCHGLGPRRTGSSGRGVLGDSSTVPSTRCPSPRPAYRCTSTPGGQATGAEPPPARCMAQAHAAELVHDR